MRYLGAAINIPNFEPGIYRHRAIVEFRILESSVSRNKFKEYLKNVSRQLKMQPHPEQPEPIITSASGHTLQKHNGLEAMLFWLESGLHAYYWERPQFITLDMHSCAYLDKDIVEKVTRKSFEVCEYFHLDVLSSDARADSKKIEIKPNKFGRGIYAKEFIGKDEFIAGFYGEIYEVGNAMALPENAVDHAIQFGKNKWRNASGIANLLNHSCEPNCGIKGLFDVFAMRDIEGGEELLWDYAMSEDSNWEVPGGRCLCGSVRCRGRITRYRDLPLEIRDTYQHYLSSWLKH